MKLSFVRSFIRVAVAALLMECLSHSVVADDEFRVGETIVIAHAKVELKRGAETVATVLDGQRLKILQTNGEWLGTSTTVNGRTVTGWVQKRQVLTPARYAERRTTQRRSSYQPTSPGAGTSTANRGASRSQSKRFMMGQQYGSSNWRADRKVSGN